MENQPPPSPFNKLPEPPAIVAGASPAAPLKSKNRWPIRIAKFFIWSIILIFLLVAGTTVILHYFFPAETLRPIIEREATNALKTPVTIGGLKVSLFRGLTIQEVRLGSGKPIAQVGELILDYDLRRLAEGELVINQVSLVRPTFYLKSVNGVWNFQPLLELGGEETKPAPAPAPTEDLPFAIDVKNLSIQRLQIDADIDGHTKAHIEGFNLQASGKIALDALDVVVSLVMLPPEDATRRHNILYSTSEGEGMDVKTRFVSDLKITPRSLDAADASGTLAFTDNEIFVGKRLPSPDLKLQMDASVSMKPETLNLRDLDLEIGENNRIQLAARASDFQSDPKFDLEFKNLQLNFDEIMPWVVDQLAPTTVSGLLKMTDLQIAGSLKNNQPETLRLSGGNLTLENVSANHPPLAARVDGLQADLDLINVEVRQQEPQKIAARLHLKLDSAGFEKHAVRGLDQTLTLNMDEPGFAKTRVGVTTLAQSATFQHPEFGRLQTSLRLTAAGSGSLPDGDLQLSRFNLALGNFFSTTLDATVKDFGKKALNANQTLDVNLEALQAFLPKKLLQDAGVNSLHGKLNARNRLQGKLDDKFQPQDSLLNATVALKQGGVELQDPPVQVLGLELQTSVPVMFNPKRGVKVPSIDLNMSLERVFAMGVWDVGPTKINTRATMKKFYPLDGKAGMIPVSHETNVQVESIAGTEPAVNLSHFGLKAQMRADLHPDKQDVRNATLKGEATILETRAMDQIQLGKFLTRFSVDLHDKSLERVRAQLNLEVEKPKIHNDDLDLELGKIHANALARMNLKTGDVSLDLAGLQIPDLLKLEAGGKAAKWGETFDVTANAEALDLDSLWKILPPAVVKDYGKLQVAGSANFNLTAKGKQPDEKAIKKLKLPLAVTGKFGLDKFSLDWPEQFLKIENAKADLRLALDKNNVSFSGDLMAEKLFKTDALEEEWLDPALDFDYQLKGWNRLDLKSHRLTFKNRGLVHTMKGHVDGLKPFLTQKAEPAPAELARRLDVDLSNKIEAQTGSLQSLLKDMRTQGAVFARLRVKQTAGKKAGAEGEIGFKDFGMEQFAPADADGTQKTVLKLTGLNGKFPFAKDYLLDRKFLKINRDRDSVSEKGFFAQLKEFSRYKNNLTVDSAQFDVHRVDRLGMNLYFKDNRLALENFLMKVLKGAIAGKMFLVQTNDGPALKFSSEFAGLDFNEMLAKKTLSGGKDSEVDGNVQFNFKIGQGGADERVTLDQISMKIALTRIGEETLDRILLFLDPEESNPTIVDTRAKIKLAIPHRVVIGLENGNINLETWVKSDLLGGIVQAPSLKRVPVTNLKEFAEISDQIQALAGLSQVLSYLSARGIEFKEDGEIRLF